jgi:hypothetical protein
LYKRIHSREQAKSRRHRLTERDIRVRFDEEIRDMKKTMNVPCVYVVNDSPERVKKLLAPYLRKR